MKARGGRARNGGGDGADDEGVMTVTLSAAMGPMEVATAWLSAVLHLARAHHLMLWIWVLHWVDLEKPTWVKSSTNQPRLSGTERTGSA